jgi:hypothetical protein
MGEKRINIDLSHEEYEKLRVFKEERGLTWRGLLLYGIEWGEDDSTT